MNKPFRLCIGEIEKAAGRPLSDDELNGLAEELARRRTARSRTIPDVETATREAAAEMAADMNRAAAIEKRNTALNLRARLTAVDFVRSQFADNPRDGVEAILVGINSAKRGTRDSVAAAQEATKAWFGGGFISDMQTAGLWKEFVSGAYDRETARALWALDNAPDTVAALPKPAVEMAKVIRKWQETARVEANKVGANIGKLPGYIVRQGHDVSGIRSDGYAGWRAAVINRLDLARTFGDTADIETALKAIYNNLASGIHLKAPGDAPPSGFKGPANLARKMSAERVLHFKSADDWFDYNAEFGTKTLNEAVLGGLENAAQNIGIMKKLGPNPGATFAAIIDDITRGIADPEQRLKFDQAAKGYLSQRLAVVDGTARVPVNAIGAKTGAIVRAIEGFSKLGGALLSSFTDIPAAASELVYQGHGGYLSGIARQIVGLFKGRNRKEMAEVDGLIGVYMDGMRGQMSTRFSLSEDGPMGGMTKLQRTFFKFNGLTWWTDAGRASAIRSMAHLGALRRNTSFDKLGKDYQRVLGLYGIDGPRWDAIRQAATKEADGRQYLTTEGIEALPDEAVAGLRGASPEAIKRDLADRWRTYLTDRGNIAVLEPDARNRAIMTRGSKPGTVEGEFLRFIGQFKSYVVGFSTNIVGREIYGRGANVTKSGPAGLLQALRGGNGEMLGLAKLILWTTLFGYAGTASKDIFKGRNPRDPLDPKTWMAAMVQGGGLGIYGDFLFGEANRFGGGLLGTVAGPTFGAIEDLHDIYQRVRDGDDAAARAFRFLLGNTPFLNMFYTRIGLDYLILNRIQEELSPGALRRLERRIEKENNQTFWLRPSEYAGR